MRFLNAVRVYFDRENYGTETLAQFVILILKDRGHDARYGRIMYRIDCENCELRYYRLGIVMLLARNKEELEQMVASQQ